MNGWIPGLIALILLTPSARADQSSVASRMPTADTVTDEAAIRKADADWAKAAQSGQVDAWVAFYAEDALVLPPNETMVSNKNDARKPVGELLALPGLSITWHPTRIEVARSGDVAYLIGAYELSFNGVNGSPVTDRGKLVEVWKKQSDGSWKCIVDTWNSDLPASPHAAPPVPLANEQIKRPAMSVSTLNATPSAPNPTREQTADYGEMPAHYQDAIQHWFQRNLMYPDSIQYQEVTKPEKGYTTVVRGLLAGNETHRFGWTVKATINEKNAAGGYGGFKTYTFLFHGDKIVSTVVPASQ
jgi:ketosteroid isomerase-like protein